MEEERPNQLTQEQLAEINEQWDNIRFLLAYVLLPIFGFFIICALIFLIKGETGWAKFYFGVSLLVPILILLKFADNEKHKNDPPKEPPRPKPLFNSLNPPPLNSFLSLQTHYMISVGLIAYGIYCFVVLELSPDYIEHHIKSAVGILPQILLINFLEIQGTPARNLIGFIGFASIIAGTILLIHCYKHTRPTQLNTFSHAFTPINKAGNLSRIMITFEAAKRFETPDIRHRLSTQIEAAFVSYFPHKRIFPIRQESKRSPNLPSLKP